MSMPRTTARASRKLQPKVQEVKLNTATQQKSPCPPKSKKPTRMDTKQQNLMERFKNIDFSRESSDMSLHVQTLELPDVNNKYTKLHVRDACGQCIVTKKTAVDLSSTSNSHFRDGVQTVKMRKRTCTESSLVSETTIRSRQSRRSEGLCHPGSQDMIDSWHRHSERRLNTRADGEWRKPCVASFDAHAPAPHIGKCPKNYEELAKMSKTRQKFFLTQDPRKTHCLVNPEVLRRKKTKNIKSEFDAATKIVKQAENTCDDTDTERSESFICDVIDMDNPMGLDFQGMDYKNTYERDEQELQNQNTYWRVRRYMERMRVKKETKDNVEQQLQRERVAVPAMFATTIKDEPESSTPVDESPRLAKLYRTWDKPENKAVIEKERQERRERYKDIYLRNKSRELQREAERKIQQAAEEDQKARTVAEQDFQEMLDQIDDVIERNPPKIDEAEETLRRRRVFPKTLQQTKQYQQKMHQENCIRRDTAIVKKAFFLEHTGKMKKYQDANLNINCDDTVADDVGELILSEKSSDDEDGIVVGKVGDRFMLRGFHFKHGEGLRGKWHRHEIMQGKHPVKGCQTREEWLNELAQRKEPVKLDIDGGIIKDQHPDDPNLVLFPPKVLYKQHLTPLKSSVREYIKKPLGTHYHRKLRKNVKQIKPKLPYNVRKFNLIRYVFPETMNTVELKKKIDEREVVQMGTTLDYIKAKNKSKKQEQNVEKLKRMELLGLPCKEIKNRTEQQTCEYIETDSSDDWVPEAEAEYRGDEIYSDDTEVERVKGGDVNVPLRMRGNMPAPQYREKTLKIHPRRVRDYETERIPSVLFHEAVETSKIPILEKLEDDRYEYANVHEKKRAYSDKLDARHHHDHWKPTQNKTVHVHYHTKVVRPTITEIKPKISEHPQEHGFVQADPPCKKYVNQDLTRKHYDFDEIIREHKMEKAQKDTKVTEGKQVHEQCTPFDFVFHSRDPEELAQVQFPGRQEYLDFLHATKELLYEQKAIEPGEERLFVDKQKLIAELEEDLKSIEGCLTSLSSSDCTNLSNDSGSYLVIEGKTKLPLDYIRHPLVPFEELERSRFKAKVIDVDAEDQNPFRLLPFSGQLKAQQDILRAKDSFFTFNTRLRNGLRLRLEVPVPDVRNTLIGPGKHKYHGAVVTDIDENYIEELKTRATVKTFNFKTGMELLKDAMRLKFESLLIQGQIVRTKIYDRLNDQHWEDMQRTQVLYERLFAKWEKQQYEAAMSVVYQVKAYYETTDQLKNEYRELERDLTMLNMDIVFIEGHWIRCIMLQNFHYLLGDQEWRLENDWIHLVPKRKRRIHDGAEEEEEDFMCEEECEDFEQHNEMELESYDESIAKRAIVNIRKRDKDDAWAIRQFYYDVYMQNPHPILQVFPDAESFLQGIENLKNKTFVLLLEMHFTLAIHTELQGRLETFIDWCANDLKEKEEYVARKSAKKFFMEARAEEMEKRTMEFLDKPIEESFNDYEFNKHRAVIAEVWRRVVPANVRGSGEVVPKPSEMVGMIAHTILEILSKFEHMDIDKVRETEAQLRKRRRYLEKLSAQAYQVEKRIDMEMKKVYRNLEPPYKAPKREGKLPRLYIKKKVKKVVEREKVISEQTKFFMRAFHEDGETTEPIDTHESLIVLDTIQEQIVPFYFDHFLKINGYTPNYNFKTQIEARDGPETDRFKIREVMPDVLEKVEHWEYHKRKVMEENIQRNPKMYENVS